MSGIVRTVEGKQTHSVRHGIRTWDQRVLKQKTDRNGYKRVSLYRDKICKTWLVHRLVASVFIPKIEGMDLVNHLDGNPRNNHISNLEWCDYTRNNNHAYDMGLMQSQPVVVKNLKTGEEHLFRSRAKASLFLGKRESFLYGKHRRGTTIYGDYEITNRT